MDWTGAIDSRQTPRFWIDLGRLLIDNTSNKASGTDTHLAGHVLNEDWMPVRRMQLLCRNGAGKSSNRAALRVDDLVQGVTTPLTILINDSLYQSDAR
jgi:hypothetical protein